MVRLRQAGCVFAEEEARILVESASATDATDTDATLSATVPDASSTTNATAGGDDALTELLARRVAGEPLEQIVGWVEFAGSRLHVTPGVFVPRQRTTLLATQSVLAVEEAGNGAAGDGSRFLEAFCGVGPVAASVLQAVPGAQVHLGDHDETALECARTNAGPRAKTHLLICLAGLPRALAGSLDVIAAVPPYVPDSAAEFLPREALEHEAPTALFGGADGLDLVRRLIRESLQWLAPGGALLIELGSEQQRRATEFARAAGFGIADTVLGEDEQTVVLKLRPTT